MNNNDRQNGHDSRRLEKGLLVVMCLLISFPFTYFTPRANASRQAELPQRDARGTLPTDSTVYLDAEIVAGNDTLPPTEVRADDYAMDENGRVPFNPSPTRAVWLSALFPGLGQIYNRRYWKLPIVIGGFMGLGYATSWNNRQYNDYMQGYRDLLDNDPDTKSYMGFFPPNVDESSLDRDWLERSFKSKKDYFRRNRDLCVICLVLLYGLCMLDAYVDASLTHFDVSPSLSMDVAPTLLPQPNFNSRPALGLNWALTF